MDTALTVLRQAISETYPTDTNLRALNNRGIGTGTSGDPNDQKPECGDARLEARPHSVIKFTIKPPLNQMSKSRSSLKGFARADRQDSRLAVKIALNAR
jgi:hypothetical protein